MCLYQLGIVYFNHTHGCQNCRAVGKMDKRMSFPKTVNEPRTNFAFRNRLHSEHHRIYTPLEELPIDMINDFVIADPLHLLELGTMKKLMCIWLEGKVTKDFKLNKNDRLRLDDLLLKCNLNLPSEIHRSVRSIEWIKFWKGTEFRTLLLYIGVTVFRDILHEDAYVHFLYLFSAVTICSTDTYKAYVPLAKNMFDCFIEMYIDLYGSNSITSNVHNLCHVVDNVNRFGNLNTISTYPFENAARQIKLKLKQCNKSLEQVSRRIREQSLLQNQSADRKNSKERFIFKFPIEAPGNSNVIQYKYICINKSVIISNRKKGDKWFLTKSDEIVEFKHAYITGDQVFISGTPLKDKRIFFSKPFDSSFINVYESDMSFDADKKFSVNDIKCKMFCSEFEKKYVFVPLLHSFDEFN